jgi:hypothetical protein
LYGVSSILSTTIPTPRTPGAPLSDGIRFLPVANYRKEYTKNICWKYLT